MGILIKSVDISIGEVTVNLNEGLLVKKKSSVESSSGSEKSVGSNVDSMSAKEPPKKREKIIGYISKFPQKVWKIKCAFFLIITYTFRALVQW